MKGDFSRDTFDLNKNYSSVLMQQGRVLLDADWNEQTAIILNYLRTLAMDLIGKHGGPDDGFKIDFLRDPKTHEIMRKTGDIPENLTIEPGRYYVDGIPCENTGIFNNEPVTYYNQPYYHNKDELKFPFMVYLDVWERHVTCFEDKSLCEVALGGIDTTTRLQIVWQVKTLTLDKKQMEAGCEKVPFPDEIRSSLIAAIPSDESYEDPCNIEPDAKFRGAENQLYRVEIHTGNEGGQGIEPTFKWSRENGSFVFPIIKLFDDNKTTRVWLENLGRDDKLTLRKGDWVEIVDDNYTVQNRAEKLLQVSDIDRDEMRVTLDGTTKISAGEDSKNHPLLRRWDQKAGNKQDGGLTLNPTDNAAQIVEGKGENNWLKLEDGIKIQFQPSLDGITRPTYHTGEYWLIPARTATGSIEWAKDAENKPVAQLSRGIKHHYAPLGIATRDNNNIKPCRCTLIPLRAHAAYIKPSGDEKPSSEKIKKTK